MYNLAAGRVFILNKIPNRCFAPYNNNQYCIFAKYEREVWNDRMRNPIFSIFEPHHLGRRITPEGDLPDGKSILKRTLRVAWPSMLESFLVSLVGMIDTIMVSSLGSYAIALPTSPSLLAWLFLCP